MKKFLVTSALPYANGKIHFGHMAGAYLPADVFVRHQRLLGNKALFISGSDEHGVAITLNAKKTETDYQEYVNKWHLEHESFFKLLDVEFDFFGQTSSEYHKKEVIPWFEKLYKKGMIEPRESQQLHCNDCGNFLPDRYVEGECYECGYELARGDECPNCGIIIDPVKLKNPECKICGSHNINVEPVTQYFLLLSKFEKEYKKWFSEKKDSWRKTVFPFVESLNKDGLHDRAITRDLDWGIDVPLAEAKGKKLYVWFDAPIGYVSNTKQYLESINSNEDYKKDWWKNDDVEIVNFIGKDNIIFHAVIFPIMSMASQEVNPVTDVPANQYLNLKDKQFSKSSGVGLDSVQFVKDYGVDALRYYLISIMPELQDSVFCEEQFKAKINGELANNIGNLFSRCLKFYQKNFDQEGIDASIYESFFSSDRLKEINDDFIVLKDHLDRKEFRRAIEKMMFISAGINTFFSEQAPWAQIKKEPKDAMKTIAWTSMQIAILSAIMNPFMPGLSKRMQEHFFEYTDDLNKKVYQGDYSCLANLYKGKTFLSKAVENLVPKVE